MPIISRMQTKAKETRPHCYWDGYSKRAKVPGTGGDPHPREVTWGSCHGSAWQFPVIHTPATPPRC